MSQSTPPMMKMESKACFAFWTNQGLHSSLFSKEKACDPDGEKKILDI